MPVRLLPPRRLRGVAGRRRPLHGCYSAPMSLSLVIFDLDGTLIDSAADLAHAVNGVLADFGAAPLTIPAVRAMIGDGTTKLIERALAARALADADLAGAHHRFMERYAAEPLRATTVYPGVRAGLELLRERSLRLAVCTNKTAQLAQTILERLELADFFARVIGGDSLPYRKPDPRVLQALLASFATAPRDALMVGDSEVDAETAQAAGVQMVLMRYGYRRGPIEDIPCLAALEHFAVLPQFIASLPV